MNPEVLFNRIQMFTGVGVVISLALYIWELQQGHDAVSSELSSSV